MDLIEIADNITAANKCVENKFSTQEKYIFYNDIMAKHIADMEFDQTMILKRLLADVTNKDLTSAKIKLLWKVESMDLTRLIQLGKSVKKTLENLIYRGYK